MRNRVIWSAVRWLLMLAIVWIGYRTLPAQWRKWFPEQKKEAFVPTATARTGNLIVSVKELGTVEAERSVFVSPETEGKIIYLVAEGKTVSKGEIVIQLDDQPLKEAANRETLAYGNAQSNLEKARLAFDILKESNKTDLQQQKADLDFNKAELERAKTQFEKKKRLATDKLIPQTEVELADIEVRSKELTVTKGEASFSLKQKEIENKERQEQTNLQNVEFAMMMAKQQADEARRKLTEAKVTSPGAGLVVLNKMWMGDGFRKPKEGDMVSPRRPLLQIPDLSSMQVTLNVDEADIAQVQKGQKVRLTVDALKGAKFSGIVTDISTLATESDPWESSSGTPGRKNFEVTVKVITNGPSRLRPGMTANAEIISDLIPNCTYVPLEAVQERAGKRIVFVKQQARYIPRAVQLGKRNDSFVAVKKGMKAGEIVALRDPTKGVDDDSGAAASTDRKAGRKKAPAPVPAARPAAKPAAKPAVKKV